MKLRSAMAGSFGPARKRLADALKRRPHLARGAPQNGRKPGRAVGRARPTVTCRPLPAFDANYFYEVRSAFSSVVPVTLGQAWRKKPEHNFSPGQIRVGWRKNSLLLFAELADRDIFTTATAANQRMWELGDTFEIFLQPQTGPSYVELNVTPNNLHLQLRLPDAGAAEHLRQRGLDRYLIKGMAFQTRSWVHANGNRWSIYAEVPAEMLGEPIPSLCGQQWRFSFCRYDYARDGSAPVISSTSPHTVPDFHRCAEWGGLNFENSL